MLLGKGRRVIRQLSMAPMWQLLVAFFVLAVFTLQGCGGGGGEAPLTPPSGVFKTLRVGDSRTYDVSGTVTDLRTGRSESVKGTLRYDIVEETDVDGVTVLVLKWTLSLTTTSGIPITLTEFLLITQDESRSIWLIGESTPEGYDLLVEPVIMWRSPMEVWQVVTYTGKYGSGEVDIGSYRVERVEKVSVPAGSFVAFKVTGSSTTKDWVGQTLSSEETISWVVPEVGGIVREILTVTNYEDDISLKLTAVLKTYTK